MSIHDESWDRPTCVYCHKEIPYGQHRLHKDRICVTMYVPQVENKPMNNVKPYHNTVDEEYFRLLNLILNEGRVKKNRTGIDTIGVFGAQAKFDVNMNAFPILTTKKVFFKAIVHELLWFIRGDTNIKYLVDNNVHIWDEWAFRRYTDVHKVNKDVENNKWMRHNDDGSVSMFTQEQFIEKIKTNDEFAVRWGELGEGTYGGMWRAFPYSYDKRSNPNREDEEEHQHVGHVDQLHKVVDKLKINPDDRRMIVSAWHPYWVDHCALPPCHCLFHFNTEELTLKERIEWWVSKHTDGNGISTPPTQEVHLDDCGVPNRRLNVLLYQRSCDTFLGVPFNITSYCLLLAMVAHCVNMAPGTFTHTYGDLHIYENHREQIKTQLRREPMPLPKLWLNPAVKNLFYFKFEDIALVDYQSHPAIKGEVAV